MRIFNVPFENKREDKIFGGYLSLRQVIYLLFSIASLFLFVVDIPMIVKVLVIPILSTFFILCAFLKISEQTFDRYLLFFIKYLIRQKIFTCGRNKEC